MTSRAETLGLGVMLAFGLLTGASMVSYLVWSDPEMRVMFRAKANRVQEGHWTGIAKEVARTTVFEMREAFPKLLSDLKDSL